MTTRNIAIFALTALAGLTLVPSADAGFRDWFRRHMPRPVRYAPQPPPPVHHHHYTVATQQVWVPPVTQQVFVGYSRFGFPRYETRTVRAGYFQTVSCRVCSCGHRVG